MSHFLESLSSIGHVAIIGAGPAGLTAAYLLSQKGIQVSVLEMDSYYLGGISKTVEYHGFYFDIGGHRFFSKSQEIENLWSEVLPNDMLVRPRSSRIFYGKKFYSYPLKPLEALRNLGIWESFLCVLSFFKAQLIASFVSKACYSFEDWVSREFGYRLFSIFFKTYTEKVWGMSCKEISADWAAQRIQGLSLWKAVRHAFLPQLKTVDAQRSVIKTLIHTFRYPRKGPGMMWAAFGEKISQWGGRVLKGQKVCALDWEASSKKWTIQYQSTVDGKSQTMTADHVISSMPLRELVQSIHPSLSSETQNAAKTLQYRDFITVALIVKDADEAFTDNWIYIHDPHVKVGRIQNFKSWSPEMVKDPSYNCYGLEYFCFEGDGLWTKNDAELIELAKKEIAYIGLIQGASVVDATVVRQSKAYPVYYHGYTDQVEKIRTELESRLPTLHIVGRNGMHKYNNQDHAMMTAMLTVKNILSGERVYDIWRVNQDAEYHESGENALNSLRAVPERKGSAKGL